MHESDYISFSSHSDINQPRMPKTDFPRFDGGNPELVEDSL
jgi:hypothetical protein